MQKIYEKYCDPSAYNAWKKQLEKASMKQKYYKTTVIYATNTSVRTPESLQNM
jgi:hypothetical protein